MSPLPSGLFPFFIFVFRFVDCPFERTQGKKRANHHDNHKHAHTRIRLTFISNMHKHAAVGSTCRSKGVTTHEDPTSMEEKKRTEERRREELQV